MAENGASAAAATSNPIDPSSSLKQPAQDHVAEAAEHPQKEILPGDSAMTKAEKIERHGSSAANGNGEQIEEGDRAAKRVKREPDNALAAAEAPPPVKDSRQKGVAAIKAEYLIPHEPGRPQERAAQHDDDAAEASGKADQADGARGGKSKNKSKGGQNKARTFGSSRDMLALCKSRAHSNEFAPAECQFGKTCKYEHNLRKYLSEGKRQDLTTFNSKCPIFQAQGKCAYGWKCRFAGSHSKEVETADGRKELVLLDNDTSGAVAAEDDDDSAPGVVNIVPLQAKIDLRKKKTKLAKSEAYIEWMDKRQKDLDKPYGADGKSAANGNPEAMEENRAQYVEPPFRASEKRRIYYGPETPVLAPLTTQGNLPFRRLCVSLGAQVTWGEMAMGMPLIQGEKSEWALMKAHESELTAPKYTPTSVVAGYDNSKDFKFGAQIAGNKPWLAMKTTEIITTLCPHLRAVDLNCGCPIDLVYRQGAGSALLDNPGRLEKILRGMNVMSNEVPITVKIRMGTRDNHPTADKLVQRFVIGGEESRDLGEGPAGVAAITLHGRSRQQRYTRSANWEYISECAATISRLQKKQDAVTDTVREADPRDLTASNNGQVYFIGNGDCYSHEDYYNSLENAKVDSVMLARGALIKPWLFEEIESRQYLDKSASERLAYIEQFARNGLEYWGSDEVGVGTTRRFLLEWLSFSCRYVPIGILEHLPPRLGDRPPPFKGRDELESLLSSPNYKDWIKISEMFLGPAHKDFNFQPKHKSNSYEIEAEG